MHTPFYLGFSGTQQGMTIQQILSLRQLLNTFEPKPVQFHHGDCIGADQEFHNSVLLTHGGKAEIHMWPTNILGKRAHCDKIYSYKGARYVVHPVMDPLERNAVIARTCRVVIIAPKDFEENIRSGTWVTFRRAINYRKQTIIIWPDGRTEER